MKMPSTRYRDMISRFMYQEIKEGRGIGGKDYLHLDIRPESINRYRSAPGGATVTAEQLEAKLPDIIEMMRVYQGVEPMKEPVPTQPTAHYAMGGIPTDNDGRVRADEADGIVAGLYAAGECACVSVHGANRLGTNSLVDLVVFGRRGGKAMAEFCQHADLAALPANPEAEVVAEMERIRNQQGKERGAPIRSEMQRVMMEDVGVFRTGPMMQEAIDRVRELKERFDHIHLDDKGQKYNTDLLETFELGCLLDLAEVTAASALHRTESRGAHYRDDYTNRDDPNWLNHTFAFRAGGSGATLTTGDLRFAKRPVVITKFEPKERKY